ncbi:MAG: nitroreductase family protein [Lentisphaeria bacterium]|nr:nitroreductase family protein [Lentisphaeria bacterium]
MFKDLVKKARTYRRFDESDPLSADALKSLVDVARLAPCGGNSQKLRYMIVSRPEDRAVLFPNLAWAGALKDWPGPAAGERPTGYIIILSEAAPGHNVGIAAQTIQLAAAEAGYGCCMMGAIKRDDIKAAFSIPEAVNAHLVLALGKPAETVVLEPMPPDGGTAYWRSEDGVHHVPKRALEDVLVDYRQRKS